MDKKYAESSNRLCNTWNGAVDFVTKWINNSHSQKNQFMNQNEWNEYLLIKFIFNSLQFHQWIYFMILLH